MNHIKKGDSIVTKLLMPKATAVWLIENTGLTFEQIAIFCGIHILEIQAMADHESNSSLMGFNPVASSQLTTEEIKRCEADPTARLMISEAVTVDSVLGKKRTKYTPLSKRQDRPDAIAWIIKFHPEISDTAITRLLGTTKTTVQAVRTKTHRNSTTIKPRNPVQLGFCTAEELNAAIQAFTRGVQKDHHEEMPDTHSLDSSTGSDEAMAS